MRIVILQAYAKMYGSYFSLSGGLTIEAAVDFTGGIPEVISITPDTEPEILFYNLEKAFQVKSLIVCISDTKDVLEKTLSRNGFSTSKGRGCALTLCCCI